jgi:hypothetical protein
MFDFLETHFLGVNDCPLVVQSASGLHFNDDSGQRNKSLHSVILTSASGLKLPLAG